jgi:hypothetical protein
VHVARRIAQDRLAGISKSEFAQLATHFSRVNRSLSIPLGELRNLLGDTARPCFPKESLNSPTRSKMPSPFFIRGLGIPNIGYKACTFLTDSGYGLSAFN